jgi:hypothetical protein
MRKIFFLIFLLVYICKGFSQSFKAGLFSGISASQVAGDNLSGFNKAGLILGGSVKTPVAEKWFLQMEIQYINKGSRKPVSETESSYYVMKLRYAEVPVFISWKFINNFSAEGGASVGFLLKATEENEYGEYDPNPDFEKMDFSFNFGLRYTYKEHWSFNLRFSQSFIPIRKNDEINYSYRYLVDGQYNTVLQNTFCYTF